MNNFAATVTVDDEHRHTITLAGDLDMASRDLLRELIDAAVDADATTLRFVMLDVTLCGSDCAAMIAYASQHDRRVVVVQPSTCVLRTLEITGLDRYVIIEL